MTPTVRAMELHVPLRHALDGVRDVVAGGSQHFDPASASMTVSVATTDMIHAAYCLPIVAAVRQAAPHVRIALRDVDWSTLDQDLESGLMDYAVVIPWALTPAMRTRALGGGTWRLIARKAHPAVQGTCDLDTFCALDHVITEPGRATFEGITDEALVGMGRKRRVVLSVANFLVAVEAVIHSDVIAVVPGSVADLRKNDLQTMTPPLAIPETSYHLAWRDRVHGHAGHRWFRNMFAEHFDSRVKT
jgi:DNA-binding transcriptional LysR family regulator